MNAEHIEAAIIDAVQRHASILARKRYDAITPKTRPYPDLGMDSMHDLNIVCEVEAILGIDLPKEHHLLYEDNRALSIEQSAQRLAEIISAHPQTIHE